MITKVLGLAAALSVCALSQTAQAQAEKNTLRVAWDKPLDSLDFYFNTSIEGRMAASLIWDTLIFRDPVTFEYKPSLARSWKWVDDTTIEFVLSENVKFSNGDAFTAKDVAYTLNFIADPANKVLNRSNVDWIDKAEATGSHTVTLKLKTPTPTALEYLSGTLPIYPATYYEKVGPDGMSRQPVGTGPYRLVANQPGKEMRFELREDPWAESPKGKPAIRSIVARFIPEKTTQLAELLSGGIDWVAYVSPDQAATLESAAGTKVDTAETMRIAYLYLDAKGRSGDTPLKSLQVRQALAAAINRNALNQAFFGASSQVMRSPCFPTQFGCDQGVAEFNYDPTRAKALLAQAGYGSGFNVQLYGFRSRQVADAIAGNLRAVGVRADVQMLQYPALRTRNRNGQTAITLSDWSSYSINDVSAILPNFFGPGPEDFAQDPDVHRWLNEAGATNDQAKRKDLYARTLNRIRDEVYMIPLSSTTLYYAFNDHLEVAPFKDELPPYYRYGWKR